MTLRPTTLLREPGHYRGMSAFTGLWNGRGRGSEPPHAAVPAPAGGAVSRAADVPPAEEDWRAADPYASPRAQLIRRIILLAFISYFVIGPLFTRSWRHASPVTIFLLAGTVVFTVLVFWVFSGGYRWDTDQARRVVWIWLPAALTLGIALFVAGNLDAATSNTGNWVVVLTVTAAVCGRYTRSVWPAVAGAALCTIAGLAVAASSPWNQGVLASVLITPLLATFLAYTAGKRMETVATLRQTRAELAKVAVAEERLRIARDLHDLLGHTLSLITLKAELSRRVMATDAERATRELSELEAVARQSLSDVREAVAGYRQPDLVAELGAARQLLTAAGIAARIDAPAALSLPGEVDAALAWTVREGVTNVVRHAGAGRATIAVTTGRGLAVVEITDDGGRYTRDTDFPQQGSLLPVPTPTGSAMAAAGGSARASTAPASTAPASTIPAQLVGPATAAPPEPGYGRLRRTGSGLAGLSERVRLLGGDLAAGPGRPHGFRLRVSIPFPSSD
jgi:two-component system, NarL family, sensor histidine kinase DesK